MLVAYGPDGQTVIAEETPLEQLQQWSREHRLYCPNCRSTVHVRGGPDKQMQLHFAHQRGECAWSTESESVRHARGKMVLAQWLREQFPQAQVSLEQRLPEPNRIADIFVQQADGQHWAIEFQCAPLDIMEWRHRHSAYRKAGIIDTWIIGDNRREKQEAFIEAILSTSREILFLDPLTQPAHISLRWPLTRAAAREWQGYTGNGLLSLNGWVGRAGYGAVVTGTLNDISFDEQASLHHPIRTRLESRVQLLQAMRDTTTFDETILIAYLRQTVNEEAMRDVLQPLIKAYVRDPDLLRRYNYGRGLPGQAVTATDIQRVQRAKLWLSSLAGSNFQRTQLAELVKAIPFVGPYTAVAGFLDTLIALLE